MNSRAVGVGRRGWNSFHFLAVAAITLCLVSGSSAADETVERIALFNGRDLTGWEGAPGWWTVEDGALTSESTVEKPCKRANYLVWTGGQPSDFQLDLDFKLSELGNSGIQIRSERRPNFDMFGYQADMTGEGKLIGYIYHHKHGLVAERGQRVTLDAEGQRTAEALGEPARLLTHYKAGEWNHYRILCRGGEITVWLNDVKMCHIADQGSGTASGKGWIGLQMHPGPPMKVQFKNLHLTLLKSKPTP